MTENQRNYLLKADVDFKMSLGEALGLLKLTQMKIQECLTCLTEKNCDPCRHTIVQGQRLMTSIITQLTNNGISQQTVNELMNGESPKTPPVKIQILTKEQLTNQIKYN